MNSNYKLVFSEALNTWVAVAEHVSARGKKSVLRMVTAAALMAGGVVGSGASLAAPPLITPPAVNQLPTGAQVTAGTVSFSQTQTATAASMAVQQSSNQAIVNWQSFNVGANAKVNITQPNASSVLLNRVQSSDPSQIFGQINANGQVLLLNPNGVYFAPGSRVDVGSFTASTHSISDADFLNGLYRFNRNGATGSILNEGHITSGLGGYIALLAPEVRNLGVVVAQMGGTVALAAGESYELQFGSNKQLTNVLVTPATLQTLVDNGQAVHAPGGLIILSAKAASELLGGVVKNSGAISATGLVNDGGTIRLSASHKIELAPSSRISADAAPNSSGNGGRIDIITDLGNASGITQVDGTISAKGGEQGGDGGFVDTSAARLDIGENTLVTTGASMGNAGTWLLDPYDVTIVDSGTASGTAYGTGFTAGAASTILTSSINNSLAAGTNVTISTGTATPGGQAANYAANTSGNIFVNGNINWSTSASLTLTANYNINVGTSSSTGSITVPALGTLNLNPGGSGNIYDSNNQVSAGKVLMGMASTPTGGLNTGYWNGSAFTTGAATGFNGQINVAPGGTIKINNNAFTVINSETEFRNMPVNSASARYILGRNLAFTTPYTQAVVAPGNSNPFKGDFNGFGHEISGLNINNSTASSNTGLFGNSYADWTNSNISNIGVAGNISTTSGNTDSYTGGLIGRLDGDGNSSVFNAYSTTVINAVNGNERYVGGLIGYAGYVTVKNVSAAGAVTANNSVGGLIGSARGARVSYANASGAVTATSTAGGNNSVGGLIGYLNTSDITYSYATGAVNASSTLSNAIGGLAGKLDGGSITYSYATGNVTNAGGGDTGGLVGHSAHVDLYSNVYATGNVQASTAAGFVGGLIANMYNNGGGTVSYAYTSNTVTGPALSNSNGTGGLIGQIGYGSNANAYANGITLTSLYWDSSKNTITAGVGGIMKGATNTTYGSGGNGSGVSPISTVNLKTASNLSGFTFGSAGFGYAGSVNGGLPVLCTVSLCTSFVSSVVAATYNGASGGLWSLSSNWLGGIAPVAGSTVSEAIINSGSTVIYDTANVGSLGFDIKNAGTISFTGSSDVTLSGVISGAGSLTMGGNGTVTLSGANTYTGTTTITAGTLKVGSGYALGNSSGGAISVASLAVLDLNGFSLVNTNNLTLNGTGINNGGALTTSSTGVAISNPIVLASDTSIGSSNSANLNLSGVISGAGNLTKIGSANSTFSGANTYTGTTTVSGTGILAISHAQGLGSTDGGTIVSSTGRLLINGLNVGAEAITLSGGSLEVQSGTSSLSGTVTLTANSSFRVDSGAQLTLSGIVSGTGRLTKTSGATVGNYGTLVLTGTNTYSGGTTISAGTLQLGAGGTTGSIVGNVTNNATLAFSRSDDVTYAGAISGTGAVTKLAANTLTLSGTHTYTGGTTINGGSLKDGVAQRTDPFGSGTITINSGGTLFGERTTFSNSMVISGGTVRDNNGFGGTYSGTFSLLGDLSIAGANSISFTGAISGPGGINNIGTVTTKLLGSNTYSGTTTITAGIVRVGPTTAGTLGTGNVINNSTLEFNRTDTHSVSNVISGSGSVTKLGTGTLILTGANTYTGATTVSAGTLAISHASGLGGTGAGAGTTVASGATLDLQGVTVGAETLTLNGGTLATSTGSSSLSGDVAMGANSTASVAGSQLNLSGVVSGTGFSLTKTGSGSLIVSGANTYSGGTTISAGTLQLGAGGATGSILGNVTNNATLAFNRSVDVTFVGAISGTGAVTKLAANTLTFTGNNSYSGGTTISAGTLQVGTGNTTGSITGDISNSGALTFNRADDLTYSGAIGGSGSVTKLAAGVLTLSGANTYTGITTISVGTLKAGNATAFGAGAISVTSGAALDLNGQTMTSTGALTLRSTGIDGGGALLNSSSTGATYAGLLTLGAASSIVGGAGMIALSNTGTITGATYGLTLGGSQGGGIASIIGTTSGTLNKEGAGTWTLSGANTYTGSTAVTGGGLIITNATGLGTTAGGTTVSSGATLDLQGVTVGAETLTLNGGTLATTTGTSSLSGAVTLGADSTINVAGSASELTISGLVTGARALTKSGTGKLTMSRQNTFSGGLTIAAGTAIEGTTYTGSSGPFGSGTVTVQSGATLDLNNYNVYAPVTLAGGALVNNATSGGTGQGDVSLGVSLTADSIFGGSGYMNAFTAITSNGYGLVFLGTGRKNLSNVNNTLSTIATGSGVGVLNVVNNQALAIGQVTAGGSTYSGINSTGTVSVMTRSGNLTVSQNVVTTSTATSYTTPALKLGAGSLSAAGTPTGGDVMLSGTPTINVGTGGVALIYSGYATTSAGRSLLNSFAPKQRYYSINTSSASQPLVVAAAYFTLYRESPATLYTLYLPNQRFTYGTPITSLNYCYSTSASSCAPVTVTGVPATTQAAAFNNLLLDAGTYPGNLNPTAPEVTGYLFAAGNAVDIVVDPKPVTIATTARTTTYDGLSTYSNLANAMTYTVNGLVGFDAVRSLTQTPSGSGLVASNVANAGNFTVTPGSVVLSTGKSSNYTFSYTAATATVNKADLTVKANNDTKFIGEADVSGYSGVSYTGFVAGQTASVLSGSATVARSNASVGAAGTYTGVLSAAGSTLSSNNYNLIYQAGSYTIVPADQLLIRLNDASTTYGTAPSYSLASVQYKSSNGNGVIDLTSRAAVNTAAFTLSDGAGGNTALTLGPVAASLSSAGQVAAGSYQVGASSVTNTSDNYGNTVNIVGALTVAQKTLTPVATSGLSKMYDGTDSMGSLGFGLTGVVGADAVTATGVGTYANANAGNAKAFTVAGIGLGGTDAANYKLAANILSATNGVVTTAPLLIKANNDSKSYDASAYAATAGVAYSGFVNGETAANLGGTLIYSGTAIGAVNVGNYVITPSGKTSSNYAISYGNGSLYISPADVRVSATNVALTGTVGKVYDGTTVATLNSSNYLITGWQGSDGANITQTTGTYDNANAGTNKLVSVTLASSDFSPTNGTLLSNYNLPTTVSGNVGVIDPKTVTVTNTARSTTYDGTSYAALALGTAYSVGDMVGLDAVASITQTPSGFSGAASGAANAGTFNVSPSAAVLATGTDSNYNFSYVQSTHTVNQAPLSAALTGATSKVYDGNTAATLAAGNFLLTGFVNAEGASVSQTVGTLDSANVGTSKTVLAALSSSDFAANSDTLLSNYILPTSASGPIGTITPAPVVPSTPATIQPVVFPPVVISSAVQSSAPPSLMVSAVISSASPASSSAVGSGLAGGSSSGVVVNTISSASVQVPGLVAVLVPAGTATSGTGLVIALPEQVVSSAAAGAAVQVTLSNNEPLPDWIRYDAATQTLVTSAVPAGAFPLSVLVTVGGQSTVVQISESRSNQ